MKKYLILGSLTVIAILGSCKKDKSNATTGIQGTYKFKYITAQTNSTVTGSLGDKTITTSHYTTINNQGTVVFNASTLAATGLAYTVDTVATYLIYDGADLVDSSTNPFTFTLSPTNTSASYQLIGSDSIYFPQGSIVSGGSGTYQSGASGGRYTLANNLLTITQNVSKDSSFEDSGENYQLHDGAATNIVFEKQ